MLSSKQYMSQDTNVIIIFIRRPIAGTVKSRIAKTIGVEKALAVYKKLLNHTRTITLGLACKKHLYYSDAIDATDEWDETIYQKKLQAPGSLGEKMSEAFKNAVLHSNQKVIIIGSDCYELNSEIINEAFLLLDRADVVAGPATDGGYYLLGMKNYHPDLFAIEQWSTDMVLAQTLAHCEKLALEYALLPVLSDIDEAADINFDY